MRLDAAPRILYATPMSPKLVLVLGLVLGTTLVHPARADDVAPDAATQEARVHHRRGLELYDEGDYRLALVELERAYTLSGSYKVLFNIGQVHYQLTSYAKARRAFEQYLALGGDRIAPERRAAVERDLVTLRARTATLTVRATPAAAEVTIDDASAGRAPIESAVVDAGTVRVRAAAPGFTPVVREITLASGDVETMSIALERTTPEIVVTQPSAGISGAAVASWIVTGVLATSALGTGFAASSAASDYDRDRLTPIAGSPTEARAELERERTRVTGLALATDVLAVSALVAGGVSLYLTLREPKRASPPPRTAFDRALFGARAW